VTATCPHCGQVLGVDDVEVKLDELRTACVDAGLVVAFDGTVREFSPNQRSIRLMAAPFCSFYRRSCLPAQRRSRLITRASDGRDFDAQACAGPQASIAAAISAVA
jgi:hypothetical protein